MRYGEYNARLIPYISLSPTRGTLAEPVFLREVYRGRELRRELQPEFTNPKFSRNRSNGLGIYISRVRCKNSNQKKSTLRMWATCQTLVIFLNTEEQMWDTEKSKS
jgi:hypothetical protein